MHLAMLIHMYLHSHTRHELALAEAEQQLAAGSGRLVLARTQTLALLCSALSACLQDSAAS